MSDPVLSALRDAGNRCDRYQVQHVVLLSWRITSVGLELIGKDGPDHVRRLVSWHELERAKDLTNLMLSSEQAVLQGLSS